MNERDLIAELLAPLVSSPGAAGLTDDVALLADTERPTIVTMDTLVEGVHFLAGDPPETVAQKLVRVNVSDITAKGAEPSEALLSLVWDRNRSDEDLRAFVRGLKSDLEVFGIDLIGGDTVIADGRIEVAMTLIGVCVGAGPVRRSGATPGDSVWVSGIIGASGLGLRDARSGRGDWLGCYRVPDIPGLAAAPLIGRYASASIDISDGLLIDAKALADASCANLQIDLDSVPFAESGLGLESALEQATAGDDYQILFTAPPDHKSDILEYGAANTLKLHEIGRVREGKGITCLYKGEEINLPERLGFDHGR